MLGALTTINPFSIDMYLPAFGQIAADFHTDVPKVSLSLSSYFIGLAIGQIFYGPLLDRFGRKRPLYFGLSLYIIASCACLLSVNIESLIAFRLLQALGGCAAQVASVAMVRDFFSPKSGAKVFSALMLILSVSPLFAPTVGGFMVASVGWQSVFILLSVIVVVILLIIFFFLPEGHQPDRSVSLGLPSIVKGFGIIFRTPEFLAYGLAGACSFAGLFAYLAAAPSIFMSTFHLNAKTFGIVFALLSVGIVGGGQVNILLLRRFTSERIFSITLFLQMMTAVLFLAGTLMGWYGFYAHVSFFFIFLSCIGFTNPNAAALALFPFEGNAGSAAALFGFLEMGGGALTSAGFGLLHFSASISLGILFLAATVAGFIILKCNDAIPSDRRLMNVE